MLAPDTMSPKYERPVGVRATSGALWLIASRLFSRLIDFVTLLILATFLSPSDFGLVAIAMTLIYIVEAVLELPLSQALIRLDHITQLHLDTSFTIAAMRGCVIALIGGMMAWPFAHFYRDPRLIPLIVVLSFAPAFRGLQSPALAHFAHKIDFRRDFFAEIVGKAMALIVATLVVYLTHSFWAIAAGTVANTFSLAAASYMLAPYRPRFSIVEWRSFAGFLGWTSAGQMLSALNWQYDRLLLGRLVGNTRLGNYAMGSDLAAIPEQAVVKPVMRPLMAGFVAIREDANRLQAAYLRTSATLLTIAAPFMLGASLLAQPFVHAVLGTKWALAAPVLQFLVLSSLASTWVAGLAPLAMALNKTRFFLFQNAIEFTLKAIVMTPAVFFYGLSGAIMSRLSIAVIMMLVAMGFVSHLVKISISKQLLSQMRVIMAGIAFSIFLACTRSMLENSSASRQIWLMGLLGAIALVLYCMVLLILWYVAKKPDGLEKLIIDRLGTFAKRFKYR